MTVLRVLAGSTAAAIKTVAMLAVALVVKIGERMSGGR